MDEKKLIETFHAQKAHIKYVGDGRGPSENCMLHLDRITHLRAELPSTYQDLRKESATANEMWTFHGTEPQNIDSIFANGFDIKKLGSKTGNKGMYGAGIYSSTKVEQAIWYCYTTAGYIERKHFQLIACLVLAGRMENVNPPASMSDYALAPTEFESRHHAKTGELVVFDSRRIVPYCVLHLSCDPKVIRVID